MEKESFNGLMKVHTMEILMRTILRDRVNIDGQTVGFTKANGIIIKWKVTASLHGLMVGSMSENTKMIKNMGKVLLNGQTEENT